MIDEKFTIYELAKRFEKRLRRYGELGILGLKRYQVYPPRFLKSDEYILPEPCLLIDKQTPVGSMGSCFAREIKNFLENKGYNYVSRGGGQHGSAPWERVYNTACIKQEIMRVFGRLQVELFQSTDGRVIDPLRKKAVFDSMEIAQRQCEDYVVSAKSARMDSKVFILTLGLSEIWYDMASGIVFAEVPPSDFYDSNRHSYRFIEPEENYQNLKDALEILKQENPDIDVILTVSPVPLRATFFNRGAIVSNNVSKASLICAAHRITQELPFVRYFPSYEITFNLADDPFEWDYRHLKSEAIEIIMSGFVKTYCSKN